MELPEMQRRRRLLLLKVVLEGMEWEGLLLS